jgi:hypothetical protein
MCIEHLLIGQKTSHQVLDAVDPDDRLLAQQGAYPLSRPLACCTLCNPELFGDRYLK